VGRPGVSGRIEKGWTTPGSRACGRIERPFLPCNPRFARRGCYEVKLILELVGPSRFTEGLQDGVIPKVRGDCGVQRTITVGPVSTPAWMLTKRVLDQLATKRRHAGRFAALSYLKELGAVKFPDAISIPGGKGPAEVGRPRGSPGHWRAIFLKRHGKQSIDDISGAFIHAFAHG